MKYDIAESSSLIGAIWKDVTRTLVNEESQFQSCVHCRPYICIWCNEQSNPGVPPGK